MRTFFLVVIIAISAACASPTAPSQSLVVTPAGFQTWIQTDPHFTVTGGDGQYGWQLDYGDGLLVPMGPNFSKAVFRANTYGASFGATVFDHSGHRASVTGIVR